MYSNVCNAEVSNTMYNWCNLGIKKISAPLESRGHPLADSNDAKAISIVPACQMAHSVT